MDARSGRGRGAGRGRNLGLEVQEESVPTPPTPAPPPVANDGARAREPTPAELRERYEGGAGDELAAGVGRLVLAPQAPRPENGGDAPPIILPGRGRGRGIIQRSSANLERLTPRFRTPQPAATTPQPAATTPQPAATTPQPAATTPQPAATTPQPAATTPQPAASQASAAITPKAATPTPAQFKTPQASATASRVSAITPPHTASMPRPGTPRPGTRPAKPQTSAATQPVPSEPVVTVAQEIPLQPIVHEARSPPDADAPEVSVPTSRSGAASVTTSAGGSGRGGHASGTGRGVTASDAGAEASQFSGSVPKAAEQPTTPALPKPQAPIRVKVEKRGTKGDPIPIATNYVRLKHMKGGQVFEYHVDFTPEIDSTKLKRKAMHLLLGGDDKVYSFDGAMLFLAEKKNGDTLVFHGAHPTIPGETIKAVATFVKEKHPKDLVQFFNILLKRVMRSLNRIQLRRNYYDPQNVKTLRQHKLEIWPGWCVAVEEMEGGLMLCLDVSHRVLRTETVLPSFLLMRGAHGDWKEKFEEFIVGKIVLTRYNNTLYKIDDVIWDQTPTSTFVKRGEDITFVKYYKEHHEVSISDLSQPMLLSRVKPRRGDPIQEEKMVALVPELCYITGLTDEERANFTVMKDLGEHTRLTPTQRKISLEKFINEMNGTPESRKIFEDWNMQIDTGPLHMEGRLQTGATLNFGKKELAVSADFSREALSGVYDPVRVEKYLFICTQRDADKAQRFAETYNQVCRQLGIQVLGTPTILPIRGYQVNDFRRAIKDNMTEEYQFLVCLMPQQRDDVYSLIKKLCVSELEVPSQCILSKTLMNEKRFKSVIQKIALQINCKLGGALWALKIPIQAPIMFVGIDVAHDPKRKNPSVLGMVCTLNNECTKYASVCRIMKVHQETADSIQSAFIDVLNTYKTVNGQYPLRIVVWRDGGLADPRSFNQHEVKQVAKAIEDLCPDAKYSFVVVQKRISQRFFKTDRVGKNWENPPPGTVIDHTVTRFDEYDFYVVSQLVRQGTVSPTHYVVIADSSDTKPDLIQKFAYVCSFMYYNWPGTVRVPAMTQYAHKLAGLVGSNVRAEPGKSLNRTLYYL